MESNLDMCEPGTTWRERPLTAEELFEAEDGLGARGWWLRLNVTGLYARRFGPFATRDEAEHIYETFLDLVVTEALCEAHNSLMRAPQRCVIEDELVNKP